jgi:hypothetical protein
MDGLRRHILPGLTSTPRAGHFIFKATEEIAISAKTRLLHYFQKIQKTEGDVRGMVSDTFAIVRNYFELGEEKRMENENAAEVNYTVMQCIALH